MSEVEDLLDKTEPISVAEYRKETKSRGRSTEYKKYADLAKGLDKIENGGEPQRVREITESQVSSIRTQVDKLNPKNATKKEEKEFVATRRKIGEDDDYDTFDEDGNQLYNLYIARKEPEEEPSGGQEENGDSET